MQRYLDDFAPGAVYPGVATVLEQKHFAMFSAITGDDHPIHRDADYARARGMPGPAAHGLLLLAMTALGAAPIAAELEGAMIAMMGTQARFKRPATIGDTVRPEFEVVGCEPKDDARGLLRLAVRLLNQRGETLLEGEHVLMLRRAPR
jgi:acyl dehydratase